MKRVLIGLLALVLLLSGCGAPAVQVQPEADVPSVAEVEQLPEATEVPEPAEKEQKETDTVKETVKPQEQAEPAVQEAPKAEEPDPDKPLSCTLSIRCDSILSNLDKLDSAKADLVPADGVILAPREVTFYEGDTVFNMLQRETKRNRIHLEFSSTPAFNSAYIEGIANLYEFDCGSLSGWIYFVNGKSVSYGCSRYALSPGDTVEWVYTCDLGRDVGAGDAAGEYFDAARGGSE